MTLPANHSSNASSQRRWVSKKPYLPTREKPMTGSKTGIKKSHGHQVSCLLALPSNIVLHFDLPPGQVSQPQPASLFLSSFLSGSCFSSQSAHRSVSSK